MDNFNSRLDIAKEWIIKVEDKSEENNQTNQKKIIKIQHGKTKGKKCEENSKRYREHIDV